MSRLKKSIPWLVTFGILWFLFNKYDPRAILDVMASANLAILLPLWTLCILVVFLADTGCLIWLFRMCDQPVPPRAMLEVKGASYLLNVINYNAASGGIAYFVSKRNEIPLLKTLSSMLMLSGMDFLALALFVFAAQVLEPGYLPAAYEKPTLMIAGALWVGDAVVVVIWAIRNHFQVLRRASEWSLFACLRSTTVSQHLALIVARIGFLSLYFFTQYLSLGVFGVEIPLVALFGFNAILTLVGIIPISIAGLGTTQVVMVALYAPYAAELVNPEATILGYSTAIIGYFVLVRLALGAFFFNRLSAQWQAGFKE